MKITTLLLLFIWSLNLFAADKKTTDLTTLPQSGWAAGDVFPIVDVSASETKKTTVSEFDLRYLNFNLTQTANTFWGGPTTGSAAAPTFRALVAADIPNISAAKITSGQGTLSTTTTGLTVGSGTNALLSSATINIQLASGASTGLLSSTDWTTFNGKQAVFTANAPILFAGNSVAITQSTTSTNGYLSSTDWNTFNNKQATVTANAPILFAGNSIAITTASASLAGSVSTAAQVFAGEKKFSGGMAGVQADDSTTGTDVTLSTPTMVARLTMSISGLVGITAPTTEKLIILTNISGSDITVKNETTATAINRILTGTGANITFGNGANLWLYYDTTSARWRVVGGSGGGGSGNTITSSTALAASGTISISTSATVQTFLVAGNSAAVTLSTTPFGSSPPPDGSLIYIIGNDDTKTVTFPVNDASNGCLMNGNVEVSKGQMIGFMYSSTLTRYVRLAP